MAYSMQAAALYQCKWVCLLVSLSIRMCRKGGSDFVQAIAIDKCALHAFLQQYSHILQGYIPQCNGHQLVSMALCKPVDSNTCEFYTCERNACGLACAFR